MSEGVPQFSYSLNLSFNNSCSNDDDPAGSRLQYVKINNDNTIKTNSASPLALVNTAVPQALQQVLTHFGVKNVLPTENSSTFKDERSTNDETFSNFQKIQDYSILNSTSYPNVSNLNTVRKIKIKRNKAELKKKQNEPKRNVLITKYIKRLEVTHQHKKVPHSGEICKKLKSKDVDHLFNVSEERKNIVLKDSIPQKSYVLKNSNETDLIIPPCTDKSTSLSTYYGDHKSKKVNETGNRDLVMNNQMIQLKDKSSRVDSHSVKKKRKHEEFCEDIQRKQKKCKKKCLSENVVDALQKSVTDNLSENIDDNTITNENTKNSNCDVESIVKHNSPGKKEEMNRTNVIDMKSANIDGNNEKAHDASGYIEQISKDTNIKRIDKADKKTSDILNFEESNSENIHMNDKLRNTVASVMNENAGIVNNLGENKSDNQCENISNVTLNDKDDRQVHNIEKHDLDMLEPEKHPIQELERQRKRKQKYKSSEADTLHEKSEGNTETVGLLDLLGHDIQSEQENEEDSNIIEQIKDPTIIEPIKDPTIIDNDQRKQLKENTKQTHLQKETENIYKSIPNSEESDVENIHMNDELRNIPPVVSVINENVEMDNNLEEDKCDVQCENISDVTVKNSNLTEGRSKENHEIMDKVGNLSSQIDHDHNIEKHDSDMLETENHPTQELIERKRKKNHKPSETDVSDGKFEGINETMILPDKVGHDIQSELYNEDDSNIIEPIKDATIIENNKRKEFKENTKLSYSEKLTKNIIEKEPVKKEPEGVEIILTEEINIKSDNEGINEENICKESEFLHENDERTEEDTPYRIDSPKDDQNNKNHLKDNSEQSVENISDEKPIKKASKEDNIIITEEIDIMSENEEINEEFICKEPRFFHENDEQTEEKHESNNLSISCHQIDLYKDAKNVNIIDVRVITAETENIEEESVSEYGLKTSIGKEIVIQHRSDENQDGNENFISQYKNNTEEDKTSRKIKKKKMVQDNQTVEQKTELKAHSIPNTDHLSTEHTNTNLKTDDEVQIDNNMSETDISKNTTCDEFIKKTTTSNHNPEGNKDITSSKITNTDEEKKAKSQKKKQKLKENSNENSQLHSKIANEENSEGDKSDVNKKTPKKNSKKSKNKLVQSILIEEINLIKSSDHEKIELMSGCKSNKKIKINVSRLCNQHNSVKDQKPTARKKKHKKLFDTNADNFINFENSGDNTSLGCSKPCDKNTIKFKETSSILDRQTEELKLNAIEKQSTKQMKKYEAQEQKNEEKKHPNNEFETDAESICDQRDNLNESTNNISPIEKISTTQNKVKKKKALEEKEISCEKVNQEANSNKKHIDHNSCSKKKVDKGCDKKEKKKPKSKIQLDERVSNILSEKFKSFFDRLASQDTEGKITTNKSSSKSEQENDEVKNQDISEQQEKISLKKSKSSTQSGEIAIGESEEDPEEEYRLMQSYVMSAQDSSSECEDRNISKNQKKRKKSCHKSQDKDVIEQEEENSPKKSKSYTPIDNVSNESNSENVQDTKKTIITNDDINLESEEDPEDEYRKMQAYVLSAQDKKKKKKSSHKSKDIDVTEEPEKISSKKSKSSSSIDDVPTESQSKNVQASKIIDDNIDLESEEDPEEEYRKMQSYVLSAQDSSSECGDKNNLKNKKKKKSSHKSQDIDVTEEPEKNISKSSSCTNNKFLSKNVQATKIIDENIDLESEEDPEGEYRKMQSYVLSAQDSSSECGDRNNLKGKKKKSSHKSQHKDVIEEPEKISSKKSKSSSSIDDVPNESQSKNVQATKIIDDIDLESEEDPEEEYRKMQSYVLSAQDSSSECGDKNNLKNKKKKKSSHKSQDIDVTEEPEKNISKSSSCTNNKFLSKNVQATKIIDENIDLESEEDPEEEYRKMQSYVISAQDSSSECGDKNNLKDKKKKKKSSHKSKDIDVTEEPEKISSKKSKSSSSIDDVPNESQSKNVQATKIIDNIDLESEEDPKEEYRKMQSYVISAQDSSSECGDKNNLKDKKDKKKKKSSHNSKDIDVTEEPEKISSKKSKSSSSIDDVPNESQSKNVQATKIIDNIDLESEEDPEEEYRKMQSYVLSDEDSSSDSKNVKTRKKSPDKVIIEQQEKISSKKSKSSSMLDTNSSNFHSSKEMKGKAADHHFDTESSDENPEKEYREMQSYSMSHKSSTGDSSDKFKINNKNDKTDQNDINIDDMVIEFQDSELECAEMQSSVLLRQNESNCEATQLKVESVGRDTEMKNAELQKHTEVPAIIEFTQSLSFEQIEINDSPMDKSTLPNTGNHTCLRSANVDNDHQNDVNYLNDDMDLEPFPEFELNNGRSESFQFSPMKSSTYINSIRNLPSSDSENDSSASLRNTTRNAVGIKRSEKDGVSKREKSRKSPSPTKNNEIIEIQTSTVTFIPNDFRPMKEINITDYDQSAVENEANDRNRKSSEHNSKLSIATKEDSSADSSSEENIKTNISKNKPKTKARREQKRKSTENKKTPKERTVDNRIKKRKRSESKIKKVQKKNKVDESARKNGSILAFFGKEKKDNKSKFTTDSSQIRNEASVRRKTESPANGEQHSESLNVSISNGEKDNSYSFADILSQSHTKRLEKEVEDILDKTSGAETSVNSDRGLHSNYSSSSEDNPPTPKKVLDCKDRREEEPRRNTENIKAKNIERKSSSISKDEQDLNEKRKKKKIIKLIKESKTLWEIRRTLEMDENDEYMKKIKKLVIENPHHLTRIQRISPSIINPPNAAIKEILGMKGIELKLGHFSQEEDNMIEESWNNFCQLHDWDVNDHFPFLNCPSKSLHSVLTHRQLAAFVQFISHGFKNRTMDNVYSRFQRIFTSKDRNNERFTKEDDKIIMLYKETTESSRPFAEIGMILNRKRDAVLRRYHLLQRNGNTKQYKIQWNKALTEKFLVALIEVTCSINLAELKDRNITPQEWAQVGERMKLPAIKLKRSWLLNFYPRFFTTRYSKNIVNTTEKLVDIVSAKYSNWAEVDWGAVSDELGEDLPRSKCSKIVRDLVRNKVPLELRNNLKEAMKFLSLQELKSGPDNFSFVREILKETKNGTILPVINEKED